MFNLAENCFVKFATVEQTNHNCDRTSIKLNRIQRLKCVCRKDVTEDGWRGLSCLKSAGRFSRHSKLNALIKQSLSSTHIPSVLEPRHLYRTHQKRPDGLTLVPWAVGKHFLWDVTVVDFPAPCRINACLFVTLVRLPLKQQSKKTTSIKIL